MDEFNCNFNAPMFVDFEREDFDSNPESYFEVDHEAGHEAANAIANDDQTEAIDDSNLNDERQSGEPIQEPQRTAHSNIDKRSESKQLVSEDNQCQAKDPVEVGPSQVTDAEPQSEEPKPERQQQRRAYKNLVTSWNHLTGGSRPASGASLSSRPETPTRKALRQAVAETVAAVTNSPKLNLPMRGAVPKRLHTNTGDQPRLGGTTSKPAETATKQQPQKSPGVSRLRKVVNQMTPEVLKNAREARRLKQMAAAEAKNASVANNDVNKTVINASNKFKEQLANNRRMAVAKSVSVPLKGVTLPVVKPVHPTNPQPFKFATDSRIKPSSEPKTGDSSNQVDFLKMLRTYKPASSTATSNSSGPTQVKPFNFAQATASSSLRSRSSNKIV